MKNVMYGMPRKYDTGIQPSIAMNNSNYYIEVHQSENTDHLWSNFGKIGTNNQKIVTVLKDQDDTGASGYYPMVAINDGGTIVVVFQNSDPDSGDATLKYIVGIVNDSENVEWGDEHSIGFSGLRPSVVVSGSNKVLLVFGQTNNSQLEMAFGSVNISSKTVTWDTTSSRYSYGENPRIALNSLGNIVEVHNNSGILYYSAGTVNFSAKTVSWGHKDQEASNERTLHNAFVTLNENGFVVVLYQESKAVAGNVHEFGSGIWDNIKDFYDYLTTATVYKTKVMTGAFSGSGSACQVTWQEAKFMGWGNHPGIACNENLSMIAQRCAAALNEENSITGNDTNLSFYTSRVLEVGNYTDRANWMNNLSKSVALKQLVIPAAHDAGMYTIHDCTSLASTTSTQTQNKTFAQMLNVGIRYFDIRPSRSLGDDFCCCHKSVGQGCYGAYISDILSDVATFLNTHKEVVILKFSHYEFPNGNNDKKVLEQQVRDALSGLLMSRSQVQGRIADMTVAQIVSGSKGVAIPVFEPYDSGDGSADYDGLYTYADYSPSDQNSTAADLVVYDKYADDNTLTDMRKDQVNKLHNTNNHGGDMFLFSWTLTQQVYEDGTLPADQLRNAISDLAVLANNMLTQELSDEQQQQRITKSTLPNLVYVDFCDDFVTDICTWLNYCVQHNLLGA